MRLQLIVALAALLSMTSCGADPAVQTRAGYRQFQDARVKVSSPRVDASVGFGESTTVSPYWTADVITAATPTMAAPDAVTRATEYSEVRHEAGVGGSTEVGDTTELSGNYTLSNEPDYRSHTAGVGLSRELFRKMSTASIGAKVSSNEVGNNFVADFDEQMWAFATDLGWTQVLNARTIAKLTLTTEFRDGYQANPYRYVGVFVDDAVVDLVLPENLPDRRLRNAADLLMVWSLSPSLSARGSYRFYVDDWRLASHTLRLETWWEGLGGKVRARLRFRGYNQSPASFFSSRYETETRYRTGDYRFSPMSTLAMGVRADARYLEASFADVFALSAGYETIYFRFWDYTPMESMLAHLFSVALTLQR